MLRSIGAVAAGWAVGLVLSVVGSFVISILMMAAVQGQMAEAMNQIAPEGGTVQLDVPLWIRALTFLLAAAASACAGFVTAEIAERNKMIHAAALAAFTVAAAVAVSLLVSRFAFGSAFSWDLFRAMYSAETVGLMAVGVAGNLLGGHISIRGEQSETIAS